MSSYKDLILLVYEIFGRTQNFEITVKSCAEKHGKIKFFNCQVEKSNEPRKQKLYIHPSISIETKRVLLVSRTILTILSLKCLRKFRFAPNTGSSLVWGQILRKTDFAPTNFERI